MKLYSESKEYYINISKEDYKYLKENFDAQQEGGIYTQIAFIKKPTYDHWKYVSLDIRDYIQLDYFIFK